MADKKISDLVEDTSPAAGDYLVTVDIDDLAMGSTGTDKKVKVSSLLALVPPAPARVTSVAGKTGDVTLSTSDVAGLGSAALAAASAFATAAQGAEADAAIRSITLATSGVLHTSPVVFTVAGGAAAGTLTLAIQSANAVFAGPATGPAAAPTFRALAAADIPAHSAVLLTSGTVAVAQLGTGTPAAGKYVDGGTGAWTALPSGGKASSGNAGDFQIGDGAGGFVTATAHPIHYDAASGNVSFAGGGFQIDVNGGLHPASVYTSYIELSNYPSQPATRITRRTGQTSPVVIIRDEASNATVAGFDQNAALIMVTQVDSVATSSTFYFSTTLNKPAFKDSAGVVGQFGAVVTANSATSTALTVQGVASQSASLVALQQLSSTSTARTAGILDSVLATATDATWKGRLVGYAGDYTSTNAGKREGWRIESDGTQALLSFFGSSAVARPILSYSRSAAGETAALAALRGAFSALGLIVDSTTA